VEAWGRGIEKIRQESKNNGNPEPIYEHKHSGFWIEFPSPKDSPNLKEAILGKILENPNISTESIATLVGKSKRTVLKKIDELKKEGRLERIGSSRSGKWKVL
jgi:predicted HTH transcriptional regulator